MNRASSLYMRMLCTALFCTFSIVYLYCCQSDILFRLQHAASNGRTFYSPVVGALLITVVMKLLQVAVYSFSALYLRGHALTYLPSCLCIAILTSLGVDDTNTVVFGVWKWAAPVTIILFILLIWAMKGYQRIESTSLSDVASFNRLSWINVLQLSAMFLAVILIGIHDEGTHLRAHAQRVIYNNVREFSANHQQPAKEEEKPSKKRSTKTIVKENTDSILCSMLMAKNLNGFAIKLKHSYNLHKAIPRVYGEALQIYMHSPRRRYYWRNNRLSARYQEFLSEKSRAGETKNRNNLVSRFGDSYWMFYFEP